MAAGRRDADYGQKLAAIDWQHLYGQMEGYLFIEDLKSQWAERLKPDYVLIDSRTGHTEVGGYLHSAASGHRGRFVHSERAEFERSEICC